MVTMTTYDWFKECELERIGSSSDFRFAASFYLYARAQATDPDLGAALAYVSEAGVEGAEPALRRDILRLRSAYRIMDLKEHVVGGDFADAIINYRKAGGLLEQDFSPRWAEAVIGRVLAGMPQSSALPRAA